MIILDLDLILKTPDLPEYIYKAVRELKSTGYLPTGEFFSKLDDVEVYELGNTFENIHSKNYRQFMITEQQQADDLKHISLLCFLLAHGEGEIEIQSQALPLMIQNLEMLVAVENVYRRGNCEVYYENYSLFDVSRVVIKRKDKLP